MADASKERQKEVTLHLKREGKKIVSASVSKTGAASAAAFHERLKEPPVFDYKEDERRQQEEQRLRAEKERIGDVFKRALETSGEQGQRDAGLNIEKDDAASPKSPATVSTGERDEASKINSVAKTSGSPAGSPYVLLAKAQAEPKSVLPFVKSRAVSPLAQSPFKSERRESPGPLIGAKAKKRFAMAAKKIGAVVGIAQEYSYAKKEETKKKNEALQLSREVVVSLNKAPELSKKNNFLMKDKVRAKVVKAVRKAAVLSSVDKGSISNIFGKDAITRVKSTAPDSEDVLASGGSIPLQSFFRDQREDMLVMIRKFKFFRPFSVEQSLQIADVALLKIAKESEVLFRQDAVPDAAYIVLSGRVSLFKSKQGEPKSNPAGVATQGNSVGDRNQLDERGYRNFTAQVEGGDAELIVFPRADLDELVRSWRREAEQKKINKLLLFPMFAGMPISMVQQLALRLNKVAYKQNHVIYKQQDEAAASGSMYFILEGSVQMTKRVDMVKVRPGHSDFDDAPKRVVKSMEVAVMSSAEFFGELEVLNETTRNATVVTLTPCTVLVLEKKDLQDNVPPPVLDCIWRYSLSRVHWRNTRIQIILDTLQSIRWAPERDPRQLLDPEPKPLAKMKGAAILPALSSQGTCLGPAPGAWLGTHTSTVNTEAREWAMYHTGPWSTRSDADRIKDDKGPGGITALEAAMEKETFFSHNEPWST